MPPGILYMVAVLLTAVLIAPFNRLALVIVASWACGHVAYLGGVPEPWINLAQHIGAAAIGMRFVRSDVCAFVWALFAPMVIIDLIVAFAGYNPTSGWWWILILALAQLAVLPFCVEWRLAAAKMRRWASFLAPHDTGGLNLGLA